MNNFFDYDDKLEIRNELADSISGYAERRGEALQDEEHDRRQAMRCGGGYDMDIPEEENGFGPNDGYDDGEEYRWSNGV